MKRATAEWVVKAEDDDRTAGRLRNDKPPLHDIVCFHCQQCAEKYLKALLEEHSLHIPKTHDLLQLFTILLPQDALPNSLRRGLRFLNKFAVGVRYPQMRATNRQAQAALRWAERVRAAARTLLGLPLRPKRRR